MIYAHLMSNVFLRNLYFFFIFFFFVEHELTNFITYGGLDALVYLCRALHTNDLHQLGTTALTNLSGYGN
jgi:hypothetical protein